MGMLRNYQNRLPEAKIELEKAIALDRNDASALNQLGRVLAFLGEPETAIPLAEKAIRLDPQATYIFVAYVNLGRRHLLLGHTDEAIDFFRRARAANPRVYFTHFHLAAALGLKGEISDARAALAESIKLRPELNSAGAVACGLRSLR